VKSVLANNQWIQWTTRKVRPESPELALANRAGATKSTGHLCIEGSGADRSRANHQQHQYNWKMFGGCC